MRYCFNYIIPGYSAMVSSHGYFFINKGESAVYPKFIYEIIGVYDDDGNKLPTPEYIYEGKVEELGIKYLPEIDDIDCNDDKEIEKRLKKFMKEKLHLGYKKRNKNEKRN